MDYDKAFDCIGLVILVGVAVIAIAIMGIALYVAVKMAFG